MECLKCGSVLGREDYCPACEADVKLYKKIICSSNQYYNQGLERARVRDLSGAIDSLQKSLRFNKHNTMARNLLGLVFFEMGETVDALGQWVISRSLQPEDNPAEGYLDAVQSNGSRLEAINQTIKKYNQALMYCRQGSRDLAVIQLKKVLTLNPRLVKGHQLQALLYMQEGKYDQAKKSLRNAGRIDNNNTTTLRYLKEVNQQLRNEQSRKKPGNKDKDELLAYQSGNDTIIRPATFKDNSALSIILNIVVGVVIGVLITWFLVVPSVRQQAVSQANGAVREANDTIGTKNQTIKTLEDQITALETEVKAGEDAQENTRSIIEMYQQLITAYQAYGQEEFETAATALELVDVQVLEGKALELYNEMSDEVSQGFIASLYDQGEASYQSGDYQGAVEQLQRVVDQEEDYEDGYALFYLAQSLRRLEDPDQAIHYFERFIELHPGTERATTAENYLEELQGRTE